MHILRKIAYLCMVAWAVVDEEELPVCAAPSTSCWRYLGDEPADLAPRRRRGIWVRGGDKWAKLARLRREPLGEADTGLWAVHEVVQPAAIASHLCPRCCGSITCLAPKMLITFSLISALPLVEITFWRELLSFCASPSTLALNKSRRHYHRQGRLFR